MIVADASPLIALARIGQLHLLRDLYGTVVIPAVVDHEISRHVRGFEGERPSWIITQQLQDKSTADRLSQNLDGGESQALALAAELGIAVLIDEEPGRRVAHRMGLVVTGTLGVLLAAKRAGLIERLGPLLESLGSEDFRMSTQLVAELRRMAGEES